MEAIFRGMSVGDTDEPSLDFSRRKLKEAVALEKHNAASDEANDVPMTIEVEP